MKFYLLELVDANTVVGDGCSDDIIVHVWAEDVIFTSCFIVGKAVEIIIVIL